jgi:hypothetical protein
MAIQVIKEVNRDAGYTVASGATIIAGQPLELYPDSQHVRPFSGTSGWKPLGLASDSNLMFPLQGANGLTAGAGYDYTNFDRGGLVGAFVNGGEFALAGDTYAAPTGTVYPYNPTDTYTLNALVTVDSSGLIRDGVANPPSATVAAVGTVMAVTGSSPVTLLQIKLLNA